jgi:hypothetical protein
MKLEPSEKMERPSTVASLKKLMPTLSMRFILMVSVIGFFVGLTHLTSAYSSSALLQTNKVNVRQGMNDCCVPILLAPISTTADNVYMAWTNNDTGHWKVFFAKSGDGGKTFKTIVLNAPSNTGHVVHENAEITASGSRVYVTWWTNQTGTFMPVFRASNDSGNTFGKPVILNSTRQ